MLMIVLPRAVLVSRKYFELAKPAALRESMIVLDESDDSLEMDIAIADITVSKDFQVVQHLSMYRGVTRPYFASLEAALAAVTSLQKLVLGAPDSTCLPGYIGPKWFVQIEESGTEIDKRFDVGLGSSGARAIKINFEDDFALRGDRSREYCCFLVGALETWLAREEGFEICMEEEVCGDMAQPSMAGWCSYPHLWTAAFSTRRQGLAIIPGKDNSNYSENGTPESVIPIDPSFFREAHRHTALQMRLREYRKTFAKWYTGTHRD
ncbi:uncharacterized protein AB675_7270 [Cyphellophora attinorum]|uniref:Uncharacterized protein n=1 Tax=Cyphellophora attinorum TaxID=1664694 RepID=A0A0N1NWN7_9EURO|nr:uncharacterized protein AB675_7270 [Phialophora attinorum]KPI36294.1 hypothetical protein AB675_7270 [Phialophora attinorum]